MEPPQVPNQSLKAIYNPSSHDFIWEYKDENNSLVNVRIPAMEVMLFPFWLANLLANHLTDFIYNQRGQKTNPEADKAEIRKEIENVTIHDNP
jgi:hypothetical protein